MQTRLPHYEFQDCSFFHFDLDPNFHSSPYEILVSFFFYICCTCRKIAWSTLHGHLCGPLVCTKIHTYTLLSIPIPILLPNTSLHYINSVDNYNFIKNLNSEYELSQDIQDVHKRPGHKYPGHKRPSILSLLTKQWAAVTTHFLPTRVPPHIRP